MSILKEALSDALKKKVNTNSKHPTSYILKKRRKQTDQVKKRSPELPLPDTSSQDENLSFAEVMKKNGVKPIKDRNKRYQKSVTFIRKTNIQGQTVYTPQTSSSTKPKKKRQHSAKERKNSINKRLTTNTNISPKKTQFSGHNQAISFHKKKQPPTSSISYTKPSYTINLNGNFKPNQILVNIPENIDRMNILDRPLEQLSENSFNDEREINIGLDFGTSSTKVVIGDKVLDIAYTVPFYDSIGLDAYLLPSRVWKNHEEFSLFKNGTAARDLKLQLTGKECRRLDAFTNAAAFLALVIRHTRCWLLTKHKETYKNTKIFWQLTLGLPAANYDDHHIVTRFRKLAMAAWWLSLSNNKHLETKEVTEICSRVRKKTFTNNSECPLYHVSFDVIPELSAQIYGFLTSTKFDPEARNIFMIIDIGGGTIDTSIFHVQRSRGKVDFKFYASFVGFNGVSNLHAYRIDWLETMSKQKKIGSKLDKILGQIGRPTDFLGAIPESISDYIEGLQLDFTQPLESPDEIFFNDRVKKQILADTLSTAINNTNRVYEYFKGMPVFICGGGSRMKYYKKIESVLRPHPNASWFDYHSRKLEVPDILEAPGVIRENFDRLSVAFGLSFVNVGRWAENTTTPPPPLTEKRRRCPWCGSTTTCYCD